MVNRLQIKRTSTNNQAPTDGSLLPGELAVEMGTPTRLWVGVPTSIVASGKKELLNSTALQTTLDGKANLAGGNAFTGLQTINGNVGIGTSSVSARLHVDSGTVDEAVRLNSSENTYLSWYRSNVREAYIQATSASFNIWGEQAKPIVFATNNTERLRIGADGAVSIPGPITMNGNLEIQHVNSPGYMAHWPGVVWWKFGAGSDGAGYIVNNSGRYMWMCNNVDVYTQGNVVAYWSDARLKEAIEPLDGYEARIMGLRPVSFQWNDKGRELTGKAQGQREIGFIAQETKAVAEQYVAENPTAKVEEGEDPYLTVKKDEMIADLVALVQSLTKRVRELEEKLA